MAAEENESEASLAIGRILSPHGIKGWVKIFSYTDPMEQIFSYAPWQLVKGTRRQKLEITEHRRQGKSLVALPKGYEDRNQAELLVGWEIQVDKASLPALEPGEFYWHQLEGMQVVNTLDVELGTVDHMLETGANDVMVVVSAPASIDDRERMIPFVEDEIVKQVDLKANRILVEWDSDY